MKHDDHTFKHDNGTFQVWGDCDSLALHLHDAGRPAYAEMILPKADAPALALAILEAAGVNPESPVYGLNDDPQWNVRWAAHHLGRSVHLTEVQSAAAAEQAELEAEAQELFKAWSITPNRNYPWLAVAEAARELHRKDTP